MWLPRLKLLSKVSVIVPTKDRPHLLEEALTSICALRGPDLDLEVIVADNGSSSDIAAIARKYDARFTRVLKAGPSAARNAGLQVATGSFVAFLDDDDLWTTSHLRPHIRFLLDNPQYDAAVSQVQRTDADAHPIGEPYPSGLARSGRVFNDFLAAWLQIGALVARTDVVRKLGGFDEDLQASEEWDLLLRLAVKSRIGFIPQVSVLFRARAAGQPNEDVTNRYRAKVNSSVFWRNVRRKGIPMPNPYLIATSYFHYLGLYSKYLLGNCVVHLQKHDQAHARRAALWAIQTSPIHAAGYFIFRPYWRRTMLKALLSGSR